MSYEGFGGIVNWLVGWNIDDVRADARGDNEVSEALPLENLTHVFGAEEDAVN